MNKKVEELVERVRLTLDELYEAKTIKLDDDLTQYIEQTATIGLTSCCEDNIEYEKRVGEITEKFQIAQAQLNKFLNNPDLALIDRKQLPNIYKGTGYIPLAEALEEVDNG